MAWTTEGEYLKIMQQIMWHGTHKTGRNGGYTSLPFPQLSFDISGGYLPIITTRKMFVQGVLGEYAAMIRGPKHEDDFTKWGCNFWKKWCKEDGSINIDYGNLWRDYNGVNQMEDALNKLRNNPGDRRIIISGWAPDRIDDLDLPCCHYAYQFWTDGTHLDMLWHQRSADWCVGVPSDMVFAAVMLSCFAQLAELTPRRVVMQFGDAHIYDEHLHQAHEQTKRTPWAPVAYQLRVQHSLYSFTPDDLVLGTYKHDERISYELKD